MNYQAVFGVALFALSLMIAGDIQQNKAYYKSLLMGIKGLHDDLIKVPPLFIISCFGLVCLVSWVLYLIGGGEW